MRERCCVCNKPFGLVGTIMLKRNGKHICKACYQKYLTDVALGKQK